jgi:hypothetical protein
VVVEADLLHLPVVAVLVMVAVGEASKKEDDFLQSPSFIL